MNRFLVEAALIGCKEGAKLALCVVPVISLLRSSGREELRWTIFSGLAAVLVLSLLVLGLDVSGELRTTAVKTVGYSFGLFYLIALGALFHGSGVDLLGPLGRPLGSKGVLGAALFFLTLLYFIPDMAASSLYVTDIASLSGRGIPVRAAAGAGFAAACALSWKGLRKLDRLYPLFLGLPQALLCLALIKLLWGGVQGFAELSLIPSVKAGLMKLAHDAVHQLLVLLLVPDHPILSTTTWNFIGVLFGNAMGLLLSLAIITVPLLLFIFRHLNEGPPVPPGLTVPSERRMFIRVFRDRRMLKSLPIFLFLAIIAAIWFREKGEESLRLYNPEPVPVAASEGFLSLPLDAPGQELRDGRIHKFLLSLGDRAVRLLVMKKPDGRLAICLDACEVCPPDGYGQAAEHVICIYCNTPIPFPAVGQEGGCNPIPLAAETTEKEVRISLAEIRAKWSKVRSDGPKGGRVR